MHEQAFDFDELFVFDLANNHQGSVEHGLKVIREVGGVANKHGGRAAFKFQFRQLDSFIHLAHREGSDNKHIPRFLSTRLDRDGAAGGGVCSRGIGPGGAAPLMAGPRP